jgi:hypothetical protein
MVNSALRDRMASEGPENFYMDGEAPFGHCPKCKRLFTSRSDRDRHDEDSCSPTNHLAAVIFGGFVDWMMKVDRAVIAKAGLSYLDLPDQPYRDWYEAGLSAKSAAARAIRGAGG